ncbi:MAG: IgGFc-binding protein [Deltaproteobacteria bacterium]|nr:IgGFc-binding protein [Deltaproteobacteria bacterium]
MRKYLLLISLFLSAVLGGCDDSTENSNNINNTSNNTTTNNSSNNAECSGDEFRCLGASLQQCTEGFWVEQKLCGDGENPPVCDENLMECLECSPGNNICGEDGNVYECVDGYQGNLVEECDSSADEGCIEINSLAACNTPCNVASMKKSYRGCEFFAVTSMNSQIESVFNDDFVIAVHNGNDESVTVNITGNGINSTETIPANDINLFYLPFHNDMRMGLAGDGTYYYQSMKYQDASYYLTTDLPVTAYQFNPYDFELGGIASNSNDASLLLPVSVWGKRYRVLSASVMTAARLGIEFKSSPGFAVILASEDNTTVTVNSSAFIAPGTDISGINPGSEFSLNLMAGDVVQLIAKSDFGFTQCSEMENALLSGPDDELFEFCNPGASYDLTGSLITSDKPLGLWSGHNCAFVPFDARACDHLEEMILPEETWGKTFYVSLTHPVEELTSETNVVRILAGGFEKVDVETTLTGHESFSLEPGQYVELQPPAGYHFKVNASGPILVGKYTVGQKFWTDVQTASGDPAMGQVIPVVQYRSEYTFTAPPGMTVNYVNITGKIPGPSDELLILDGGYVTSEMYEEIDDGYGVARIDISNQGENGAHHIYSESGATYFGVEVYGFANYTSYMYPGGLDLKAVNPVQ